MTKMNEKLAEWDAANSTDNGKYVLSPFRIKMAYSATGQLDVNRQSWPTSGGNGTTFFQISYLHGAYVGQSFCLQFRLQFVIRKIFESAGYTIVEDNLSVSEFKKAIVYSNILTVQIQHIGGIELMSPAMESLHYSTLMPDIEVLQFLNLVKESLKPAYLHEKVYSEFLNWQTYRARAFTKYIELTLNQLIALQWGKRYSINGVVIILDKINYELPFDGKVKRLKGLRLKYFKIYAFKIN